MLVLGLSNISSPPLQTLWRNFVKIAKNYQFSHFSECDGTAVQQDQMFLYLIENIYISCTIFPRRSVGHFNGKISKSKNKLRNQNKIIWKNFVCLLIPA